MIQENIKDRIVLFQKSEEYFSEMNKLMFFEETAELIQALIQNNLENIIEEIADVRVMILQMSVGKNFELLELPKPLPKFAKEKDTFFLMMSLMNKINFMNLCMARYLRGRKSMLIEAIAQYQIYEGKLIELLNIEDDIVVIFNSKLERMNDRLNKHISKQNEKDYCTSCGVETVGPKCMGCDRR